MRKLNKMQLRMHCDHMNDLYMIFLAQLAGITKSSKARQAYQEWMVEIGNEAVAETTKERWDEAVRNSATGGPGAGIRMKQQATSLQSCQRLKRPNGKLRPNRQLK